MPTGKYTRTPEIKKALSVAHIGKGIGNQNGFKKGQVAYNKGKKHTKETRDKLSIATTKYFDKVGRSDVKRYGHKKDRAYIDWRLRVFERDKFTCQVCNQVGGMLNAHHPKEWAKYPESRFDINNGVTLCYMCHKNIHRKK